MKSAPSNTRVRALTRVGAVLFLLSASGCRLLPEDTPARRFTAALRSREKLKAETDAVLNEFGPELTLAECLSIARRRSRVLAARRLEARLARLDRDVAFSVFLPTVNVDLGRQGQSKPPVVLAGASRFQTSDQNVADFSAMLYQPVFVPSYWLLYSVAKRGEKIRRLALQCAGQMVEMQVTAAFYQAALLAETVHYQQTRLSQVQRRLSEVRALCKAGYALSVDVQRLETLEAVGMHDLAQARRDAADAKLRLLDALNLWPLASVKLAVPPLVPAGDAPDAAAAARDASDSPAPGTETGGAPATPAAASAGGGAPDLLVSPQAWRTVSLDDWLLEALLRRPETNIAGLRADISRVRVLQALSVFLPHVYAFAGRYTTSDSYLVYPAFWVAGLRGVLSLFSGFRDVHAVMRARDQVRQSEVGREDTVMMVLVQVVEARRNLEKSWELYRVAVRNEAVAVAELRRLGARQRAGLVPLSRELAAREARAAAHLQARSAAYGYAVALCVFRNTVGQGGEPLAGAPKGLAVFDPSRTRGPPEPAQDREKDTPP